MQDEEGGLGEHERAEAARRLPEAARPRVALLHGARTQGARRRTHIHAQHTGQSGRII